MPSIREELTRAGVFDTLRQISVKCGVSYQEVIEEVSREDTTVIPDIRKNLLFRITGRSEQSGS